MLKFHSVFHSVGELGDATHELSIFLEAYPM